MTRRFKRVTFSITRPANTTLYTAGDEVSNHATAGSVADIKVPVIARKGSGSRILGARVVSDNGATTITGGFRLYFFRDDVSHNGDNTAFAPSDADMANCIGYFDTAAGVLPSSANCIAQVADLSAQPIVVSDVSDNRSVWVKVVALGAYQPTSGEVLRFALDLDQDS